MLKVANHRIFFCILIVCLQFPFSNTLSYSDSGDESAKVFTMVVFDYNNAKWEIMGEVTRAMLLKTYAKVYRNSDDAVAKVEYFYWGEALSKAEVKFNGKHIKQIDFYSRTNQNQKYKLSTQDFFNYKNNRLATIKSIKAKDKSSYVMHYYSKGPKQVRYEQFDDGKIAKKVTFHINDVEKREEVFSAGKLSHYVEKNELGKKIEEGFFENDKQISLNTHKWNKDGLWLESIYYDMNNGKKVLKGKIVPIYEKGEKVAYKFKKYDENNKLVGTFDTDGNKL